MRYSYNKNFFERIDSDDKAYWLGFLYADGGITRFYKDKEKSIIRSMSLELGLKSEDKPHLIKFLKSLESNTPIQNRTHKLGNKTYHSNRVVINNTKLCKDLILLGCTPNKGLTLTFPSYDNVPISLIHHFMRGYLDGDGCIHFSENIQYHKARGKSYLQKTVVVSIIGTYEFLSSYSKILNDNGIKTGEVKYANSGKALELRIHGIENIHKLAYWLGYLNEDNIHLDRKVNKLYEAFNKFKIA